MATAAFRYSGQMLKDCAVVPIDRKIRFYTDALAATPALVYDSTSTLLAQPIEADVQGAFDVYTESDVDTLYVQTDYERANNILPHKWAGNGLGAWATGFDASCIVVSTEGDDTDGARHQRFVLRLESGQTLLVAHNIDVALRVEGLAVGDAVAFRGVYEWSAEGGTIHWTHRDPDGQHVPGWLRHDAHTYQ